MVPRSTPMGRVNDRWVETWTNCSASSANPTVTMRIPPVLPALAEPEVPRPAHAEVVVEPADEAEPEDQEPQRDGGVTELDRLGADVRGDVAEEGGDDDRDAAHRRGAGLALVRVGDRAVVADLLTDVARPQDPDEERGAEHAHHEGDRDGDQDGDHEVTSRDWSSAAGDALEPDEPAGLHEHGVARLDQGADGRHRRRAVADPVDLDAVRPRGRGELVGAGTDGDEDTDAGGRDECADRVVLGRGDRAELAASRRAPRCADRAPAGGRRSRARPASSSGSRCTHR